MEKYGRGNFTQRERERERERERWEGGEREHRERDREREREREWVFSPLSSLPSHCSFTLHRLNHLFLFTPYLLFFLLPSPPPTPQNPSYLPHPLPPLQSHLAFSLPPLHSPTPGYPLPSLPYTPPHLATLFPPSPTLPHTWLSLFPSLPSIVTPSHPPFPSLLHSCTPPLLPLHIRCSHTSRHSRSDHPLMYTPHTCPRPRPCPLCTLECYRSSRSHRCSRQLAFRFSTSQ